MESLNTMFATFQLQLSFAILSCQGGLDLSTHFAEDKEEEAEKEETAEDEDAKESGLLTPHSWAHLTSSTPPRNNPELLKAWKLFSRRVTPWGQHSLPQYYISPCLE